MRLVDRILGWIGWNNDITDLPPLQKFVPPAAEGGDPPANKFDERVQHGRREKAKVDLMAQAFPVGTEFQYLGIPVRVACHRVLEQSYGHFTVFETLTAEMVCEYFAGSGFTTRSFSFDEAQRLPGAEKVSWDLNLGDDTEGVR